MGYTAAGYADGGSYTFHFPDGNASIARLLVRHLIPESLPGSERRRRGYGAARLFAPRPAIVAGAHPAQQYRVRVRNVGDPQHADAVEVAYTPRRQGVLGARALLRAGLLQHDDSVSVSGFAGTAKGGAATAVKIPLVYASIALKNWTPFKTLGISQVYRPGSYFSSLSLNQVVDIGGYRSARSPDEPILVHLTRTPF